MTSSLNARPDGAMSDSAIEKVSIGETDRPVGAIEIRDYDPNWPLEFERQATRIQRALGDLALAIDHAGSTAVPGLAAKPILDIVLTVSDSANEASYSPALAQLGYVLKVREADWFEHRMFKITNPATNLHVFSVGCPEIERMLRFRDWLRSNPRDRQLYESVKRRLSLEQWQYVQNYADAKSRVVADIMERAIQK